MIPAEEIREMKEWAKDDGARGKKEEQRNKPSF